MKKHAEGEQGGLEIHGWISKGLDRSITDTLVSPRATRALYQGRWLRLKLTG